MVTVVEVLGALGAGVAAAADEASDRVGAALAGVAKADSRRLAWMFMGALVVRTHTRLRLGNNSHNAAL